MPWSDKEIRVNYAAAPEKGEGLVRARQVMGKFLWALEQGTVHHFHPSPGTKYSPEYVEQAIEKIDLRWEQEWLSRGIHKGYARSADFTFRLSDHEKLAFIEQLRHAMGKEK